MASHLDGKLLPLTDEEKELLKTMFDHHDTDRDLLLTAKQARTLWGHLGYPAEKSDFKAGSINLEDFIYQVDSKRSAGTLGKDDLEGRSRREFRMMVPSISDTRCDRATFRHFVRSVGVDGDDEVLDQTYDVICGQGYNRYTVNLPTSKAQSQQATTNSTAATDMNASTMSGSASLLSATTTVTSPSRRGGANSASGGSSKAASSALSSSGVTSRGRVDWGFTEEDFVDYVDATYERSMTNRGNMYDDAGSQHGGSLHPHGDDDGMSV